MTRRQRQVEELRALCRSGHLGRAVDLAFEHFATFGHDDEIVVLLAEGLRQSGSTPDLRAQLVALAATGRHPDGGVAPTGDG